ncbi:ABC transporter ATP-binding protein [Schaalia vaccimaxillae]|uniref:ATP-binding cassette domain-containing protein n=1 Tax=Schaalia vaccimaxillae TaxID=183916 RepID=UPI0003B6273A|nr:ABC transporter ATP-binding protein [Schaalia vaccimaxillae]
MIHINSLTHTYPRTKKPAINNISADFSDGSITGVIGPNGSGKTTFFKAMAGFLEPQAGIIEAFGQRFTREDLPALALYSTDTKEFSNLLAKPTIRQAQARPTWSDETFDRVTRRFNIKLRGNLAKRSQGERSLFMTALALASGAPLTLLDEPTGNLDVPTRLALAEEIIQTSVEAKEAGKPRAFVIASHLVSELENLIENVIVLSEGEIIASTTAEELRSSTVALVGDPARIRSLVEGDPVAQIHSERPLGRLAEIRVSNIQPTTMQALTAAGVEIQSLSFQDAFVSLIEEK